MKGIHRSTADSKAGRQMTSGGGLTHRPWAIPQEIRDWNAEVDRKKLEKKNERHPHNQ